MTLMKLATALKCELARPHHPNFNVVTHHKTSNSVPPIEPTNPYMKSLLPILHYLLAATTSTKPKVATTWFVDGNNLLGHKGTPRNATVLAEKLADIKSARSVVLVLDGKTGLDETRVEERGDIFQMVSLQQGLSADDYILDQLDMIRRTNHNCRIEVVTADRKLRKQILAIKPVVKGVVNPVVFWRRYLPRLCGYKLPKKPLIAGTADDDDDQEDEDQDDV
jgi:hypothetical protein